MRATIVSIKRPRPPVPWGLAKRSMAGWNTSEDQHSASATSPATSQDQCWNPDDSDRNYTLDSEEPVIRCLDVESTLVFVTSAHQC